MRYIRTEDVIGATILPPSTDPWNKEGWRVQLDTAHSSPRMIIVNKDTEQECIELVEKLGLTKID